MKVTVCFENVRVIVPCGDGSLLVRDLIDKATIRYKKATAKPSSHWVHVHFLKVSSDGGILDPDDQLLDVVDDREQIIADYEEQGRTNVPHNGGDGTSASSTGTASPDLYVSQNRDFSYSSSITGKSHNIYEVEYKRPDRNGVLITRNDLAAVSPLRVRRGSEPSLVNVDVGAKAQLVPDVDDLTSTTTTSSSLPRKHSQTHHWTTLTVVTDASKTNGNRAGHRPRQKRKKRRKSVLQDAVYSDDDDEHEAVVSGHRRIHSDENLLSHHHGNNNNFSRDSARKSLGTGANITSMFKWLDAQEKAELHKQTDDRKEPLGSLSSNVTSNHSDNSFSFDSSRDQRLVISLVNAPGPLGIHVIPNYDDEGNNTSLIIQGIEPGGRIERDGRLRVGDRIMEINGTSLRNVDFNSAQEIFKDALMTDSIDLIIVRTPETNAANRIRKESESNRAVTPNKIRPPTLPKPALRMRTPEAKKPSPPSRPNDLPKLEITQAKRRIDVNANDKDDVADDSPTRKKDEQPQLERGQFNSSTNTRRIGNKIKIQLVKGAEGLGFSITTRDNPAGGTAPIYIKNILPKGAAIQDGRLKSGDRLLKVQGVDLSEKTQADAVALLRNAKLGEQVELLVSRQGNTEQFQVPRPMAPKSTSPELTEDEAPSTRNRETLSLDIPLNETGSAGLGVSVKGKTITHHNVSTDLGIFVKSVIFGGAAKKDGRLRVNDQLLEVNSLGLTGKTNAECMTTLRRAMVAEGPKPGYINLVVSRKIGAPTPTPDGGTFSFQHLGYDNKDSSDTSLLSDSLLSLNDLNQTLDSLELDKRQSDQDSSNQRGKSAVYASIGEAIKGGHTLPRPEKRGSGNGDQKRQRPHSTVGYSRDEDDDSSPARRASEDTSPTDGDDAEVPFSREAPGRQSMSEKRKGHLDPKQMDFYQKLKQGKAAAEDAGAEGHKLPIGNPPGTDDAPPPGPLKRVGSAESLMRSNLSIHDPTYHRPVERAEVGPMLGLKKSSSLESLQAAVRERETHVVSDEDEGGFWPQNRGRVCNESFRAAVDRSYENRPDVPTMEMLEEEDGISYQRSATGSSRSSFNAGVTQGRGLVQEQGLAPFPPLNLNKFPSKADLSKSRSQNNNKLDASKDKKNIFKGLFKFGQKRKSADNNAQPHLTSQQARMLQEQELQRSREEFEAYRAKNAAEIEQKKIREQYEKLKLQQKHQQYNNQFDNHQHGRRNDDNDDHGDHDLASPGDGNGVDVSPSRAARIQQLRLEHQRRHQQRQGRYPCEDKEEWAEREIQRMEISGSRRFSTNSAQNPYDSIPDWLDSVPDPIYAQVRHPRPVATLYSDSDLARKQHDINVINVTRGGRASHKMSPRGPYVTGGQPAPRNLGALDSPRARSGSFDHPRSRSETRDTQATVRDASLFSAREMERIDPRVHTAVERIDPRLQPSVMPRERYRSKTPVLSSSGYRYQDNSYEKNPRLSLVLPSDSLFVDPLDYDDPRRAYHEPQYAVVSRRNNNHSKLTGPV